MKELIECPICSDETISRQLTSKDYFLTKEEFNIDRCERCNFLFTNPQPDLMEIGRYYESVNYVSHGGKKFSLFNQLYFIVRKFTIKNKLKLIQSIKENGNLLDYGCGTGQFLLECNNVGYQITGVEPSEKARTEASKKLNKLIEKDENNLMDNNYDIITLWHVLEHIHELKQLIKVLKSKLKQNGRILIAVPNHLSYDSKVYKNFWAAYDLPRHLWHFDKKSLQELLDYEGLKVESIVPMKLDSYYVSILSEKYRQGISIKSILIALLSGFKSNWDAKKTGEYSSLIYIVK